MWSRYDCAVSLSIWRRAWTARLLFQRQARAVSFGPTNYEECLHRSEWVCEWVRHLHIGLPVRNFVSTLPVSTRLKREATIKETAVLQGTFSTLEGREGLFMYSKSLCDDVWIHPDLSLKNPTKFTWLRHFYVSTEIKCSNPGNLTMANGNVSTSDPEYVYGATLLFECNEGYELRGRDTITCIEHGWTPRRAPFCISE